MFYPGSKKTKQKGGKKCDLVLIFVAINFTNLNFFIFEMLKTISKNYRTFIKKNVKALKIWIGIRKKPILDPGVKKAPDPQYWLQCRVL